MRLIHNKISLADKFMQHFEPIINPTRMIHPTNIIEKENLFIIEIAAPGFEKNDFNIKIDNSYLVISTTVIDANDKDKDTKNQSIQYIQKEFFKQSFTKSFSMGNCSVKDKDIKAKYEKGILYITIPKIKNNDCSYNISVD